MKPRRCFHCSLMDPNHRKDCPRHPDNEPKARPPVHTFGEDQLYWDHPAHPPTPIGLTPEIEQELERQGLGDNLVKAMTPRSRGPWPEDKLHRPRPKESPAVAAPPTNDNVVLPKHYSSYKIEPVHFLGENGVDIFQFNIIKYVMRHKMKNKLEDLRKAQRYLEMYIRKEYEGNPDWWKE